jgi:hypothetical protein
MGDGPEIINTCPMLYVCTPRKTGTFRARNEEWKFPPELIPSLRLFFNMSAFPTFASKHSLCS